MGVAARKRVRVSRTGCTGPRRVTIASVCGALAALAPRMFAAVSLAKHAGAMAHRSLPASRARAQRHRCRLAPALLGQSATAAATAAAAAIVVPIGPARAVPTRLLGTHTVSWF
jgi:hypothetical protein